jgi:acyl carrier protein
MPEPRSPLEAAVAAAWQEVLGLDAIEVDVSFFSLGADSTQVAQVVRRLRETVEPGLPLRLFFMAPTIEGIAAQIEAFQLEAALRRPVSHQGDEARESGSL